LSVTFSVPQQRENNLLCRIGLVAALVLGLLAVSGEGRAATATPMIGTLETEPATAGIEHAAGVELGMMELNWSAYEIAEGVFDPDYEQRFLERYRQLHAAGMPISLGLGLHYTPGWVKELPNSRFVNQNGKMSDAVNFVFNAEVRRKADKFLEHVDEALGFEHFYAVRISSGGRSELLYPGGGFWAFDANAQGGAGLPATVGANPAKGFKPGSGGASQAQVRAWAEWYVGALADVADWQIKKILSLGFLSYSEVLTPGVGVTPAVYEQLVADGLSAGTLGTGAAWHRVYAELAGNRKVVAHVSSMADGSGSDAGCAADDRLVPLLSPATASWSAARWISRIADEYGMHKSGENPGYDWMGAQTGRYAAHTPDGVLATMMNQAESCGFRSVYWAHDKQVWDGTMPLARLVSYA
jgi:hypothetical protein